MCPTRFFRLTLILKKAIFLESCLNPWPPISYFFNLEPNIQEFDFTNKTEREIANELKNDVEFRFFGFSIRESISELESELEIGLYKNDQLL